MTTLRASPSVASAIASRGTPLLAVEGLAISAGRKPLASALTFAVHPGEVWAVLGANGAGKTTLLATLVGLHRADAGRITLGERPLEDWPLAEAARLRGFLPQFVRDAFAAPVIDIVLAGRHPHLSRWRWEGEDEARVARDALARVDLSDFADRDVTTLSGGERQRVAIAALLAQETPLLVLDEPIAHLDLLHQIALLEHLAALARERDKAVVLSLHDPNLARRFATHALVLKAGAPARAGAVETVVDAPTLSAAYGHPLAAITFEGRVVFVPR